MIRAIVLGLVLLAGCVEEDETCAKCERICAPMPVEQCSPYRRFASGTVGVHCYCGGAR